MTNVSSWDTLDDEISAFKEEAKSRNKRTPFNFSLKKGERGKFVILEDSLYRRNEHNFFRRGLPLIDVNCLDTKGQDCPMCDYREINKKGPVGPKSLVGYITVMQLGEFKSRDGTKTYTNPVRMARIKTSTMDSLKEIRTENDNNLYGLTITAKRSQDDKSPSVGDSWVHGKRLTEAEILALNEDAKPIDFATELPVWTYKEAAKLVSRYTGATVNESSEDDEEEVGAETAPQW